MTKIIKDTIHAKGIEIGIYTTDFENEFISLTDIARYRSADPRITIHTWLRGRDIVDFLGLWESLHNPDFKRSEFDTFKSEAGTNAFTFSIKEWNDTLQGKGIITILADMAAEYIQALIDSREKDDDSIFIDFMLNLHAKHLQREIEQFKDSMRENNEKMVDKWSVKPTLAEKLVDILHFMSDKSQITTEELVRYFDFAPTTAKRYLRQLTEFGYLEALGGNKNRRYKLKEGEL